MRFLVHALHARYVEPTSHNIAMSRYSVVHVACGQAAGAVRFIKALEPCAVCKFLPFRHNCSQVTVTG